MAGKKVIEDVQDRFGRYYIRFTGYTLLQIHEWLWNRYGGEGYKFGIVLDVSKEEFEPMDNTVYVYFLDALAAEVEDYTN